jgi:hypothetical protein
MRSRAGVLRAVALLAGGAVALHQLRFVLGYGGNASAVLALEGHSYLPFAEALVAVVLAAACIWFVASLALAHQGRPVASSGHPFGSLWAYASAALLAVYVLQEGFEGAFSPGHPAGLAGIFGNGGWTALPLAVAIGALIALLLEGARRVLVAVSPRARLALPRPRKARWLQLPVGVPKLDVLAHSLTARGPPLTS